MKATVKVDKICLSCTNVIHRRFKYNTIPGWRKVSHGTKDFQDNEIRNYKTRILYKGPNGSTMIICTHRKIGWVSPLYVIITPSFQGEILHQDVQTLLSFFLEKHGYRFKLSRVDLATDIHSKIPDLYDKILRSLKPGKKRGMPHQERNGIYFGKRKDPVSIVVYDKARQLLEKKGIQVKGSVVRIEIRLYLPRCQNFIQTPDELASHDFSWIFPKHFSLHTKSPALKKLLRSRSISPEQPIWEIRAALKAQGAFPNNFHRDYLGDHLLSAKVRAALASYRWGKAS